MAEDDEPLEDFVLITLLNPMRCGQSWGTLLTFIHSQCGHYVPLTLFLHSRVILFCHFLSQM